MAIKHILTPEQVQQEKDMQYMRGKPSRIEVANYVNSLLENKYMPMISEQTEALRLGLMIVQGILITKGICTEDELKAITEEFIQRQQELQKAQEQESNTEKTE